MDELDRPGIRVVESARLEPRGLAMHDSDLQADASDEALDVGRQSLLWAASLFGHLVGTSLVGVGLAATVLDYRHLQLYQRALRDGIPFDLATWGVHVALSAALWASIVAVFRLGRRRLRERDDTTRLRPQRGAVMLEMLVVLLPFFLLTSGLAQLAIRNVAGLLADAALYQGARTAWVWGPEKNMDRSPDTTARIDHDFIETRARIASAMVLAPTAPSSYAMDPARTRTGQREMRKMRAAMYATFSDARTNMPALGANARGRANLGGGRDAEAEQLTFLQALDAEAMDHRAARKLNFAYRALDFDLHPIQSGDDTVRVAFTYHLNVVFPWFAYIFGGSVSTPAETTRRGWYTPIERPRPSRDESYFELERQPGLPNR